MARKQLRIRQERKQRRQSLEVVARRLRLSLSKYQAIESGRRDPQLGDAQRIARYYSLATDDAFARVEVP